MINENKISLIYRKMILSIKTTLDQKYFTKVTLLIIIFLLGILIWLNRYSYTFEQGWGLRINNLTGKGCLATNTFSVNKRGNMFYDLSGCAQTSR